MKFGVLFNYPHIYASQNDIVNIETNFANRTSRISDMYTSRT